MSVRNIMKYAYFLYANIIIIIPIYNISGVFKKKKFCDEKK